MSDAPSSLRGRAIAMLILATLYWGVSFPLIKAISALDHRLVPDSGTWFQAAGAMAPRFLVASALLLILCGGLRVTRNELRQGAGVGLLSAAGTLLQTDGLQFTDASTSAFLTQFSAILIPAWIAYRSRRSPGPVIGVACALVLAGVGVIGHFEWRTLRFGRGEWETLACSVFFMAQILLVGRPQHAGNRPGRVTLVMFLVEAVIFSGLAAATAPRLQALAVPWTSIPWLGLTLTLALVCTIGAFSLMNAWQPRVTATEAGLVYCVEPVFAALFALFLPGLLSRWVGISYPNEQATGSLVIGGGLITLANVLVQLRPPPAER